MEQEAPSVKTLSQHRYLLALPRRECEVFLSWRLLSGDAHDEPFHVERRSAGGAWQRISNAPIIDSTNYVDQAPDKAVYEYRISAVRGTSEAAKVDAGSAPTLSALEIPLDPHARFTGLVLGDLCNDDRMGYVARMERAGSVWLDAYSHGGRPLWRIDSHLPAGGGWDGSANHMPFLCWDITGDSRTEVAFHMAPPGSNRPFYDQAGDGELLCVVDGETGDLVWKTAWPATRARVMMTVGQLRGMDQPASLVVQDETYGPVWLTAVDGGSGQVSWHVEQARPGGHNLDIGDIDEDGIQEVICGGMCYNGDGTIRWQAEPFGHTDISKPAKIDPSREGLQIWYAVEKDNPGVYLIDKDGRTLFSEPFRHAHYGWLARHAAGVPGLHPHTAEDARHEFGGAGAGIREEEHFPIFLPDGTHWLNLTDWQRKNLVPVQWGEGETITFIIRKKNKRLVRLLESGKIEDLLEGKLPEGGEYGRNLACADIVGDFRENVVAVDVDRHCLMVLANPTPAQARGYSPYEDFSYRHDRSQHGSGYYVYLAPPITTI